MKLTHYTYLVLLLLCSSTSISAQNIFPKTGNVGIGTVRPAAGLHIKSSEDMLRLQSTSYYGFMQFSNIEGQKGYIGIYHDKDDVEFGTSNFNTNGKVHLITNGRPKFTINDEGLVGIGVTNPKQRLHIVGDRIRLATSGESAKYLELRTDNNLLSIEANSKDLYIASNSHNTFLQPFRGGVGIGTKVIPEGYLLAVGGKTIFEELHVDLKNDWPDFVFEPGYERVSIAELVSYIEENGHLPWFAAAKEMEAQGLNVAEVQRNSVEALEVITTYVIDLEESVKAKDTQLNAMQSQMDNMQQQMDVLQAQLQELIKNQ